MGNFLSDIITSVKKTKKDYEDGREKMSDKEKSEDSSKRMEAYKALCLGGITSTYWKDTTSLLNKVKTINATFASILSGGLVVSQAGMLIGLAASSFPKSSPWSEGAASNGSLFAVLFNIAAFHLEIVEFLPPIVLLISWIVLSLVFAAYWFIGSQDYTIVKLPYKVVCFVWFIMCFIWFIMVYCVMFVFRYFIKFPIKFCCQFTDDAGVLPFILETLDLMVLGPTDRDAPNLFPGVARPIRNRRHRPPPPGDDNV